MGGLGEEEILPKTVSRLSQKEYQGAKIKWKSKNNGNNWLALSPASTKMRAGKGVLDLVSSSSVILASMLHRNQFFH